MTLPRPALVEHLAYRPEIDGLRAIAVVAVVLFHAGLACPGGYVGVDVFFVISGYLITSLIVKDLESGTFTLAGFYERRARRIVPALSVVVLATLVAGWFILLPADYAALGTSTIWQSIGAANFYFWLGTGYFEGAAEDKPLLHTWSLAVEEQFYLLVPLVLALVFRIERLRRRRFLVPLLATGMVAGFVYAAYSVANHRSAAFYLLPSRYWELLLGSMLAVLPRMPFARRRALREAAAALGLAGIVAPCLVYTRETAFPGLAALPPCLGTFLILWSNTRAAGSPMPTAVGQVLGVKPLVFAGLISYSLYLWHWPLFAFSSYLALGALQLSHRLTLVALAALLAALSWRLVEMPFRTATPWCSRSRIFQFAGASLAACLVVGSAISFTGGVPGRLPQALRNCFPEEPNARMMAGKELSAEDIRAARLVRFGNRDANRRPSVLVWGDSHAVAALPAFDEVFSRWGLVGCAATHNSTPPLLGVFARTGYGLDEKSLEFNDEVVAYVQKNRIPHTILISAWDGYAPLLERPIGDSAQYERVGTLEILKASILTTVSALKRAGSQPWLVLQVPRQPHAKRVLRAIYAGLDERDYCTTPGTWKCVAGEDDAFLRQLEAAGARIIDPRSSFLDEGRRIYRITKNGVSLYRDHHHLSDRGAVIALVPVLESSLEGFEATRETLVR